MKKISTDSSQIDSKENGDYSSIEKVHESLLLKHARLLKNIDIFFGILFIVIVLLNFLSAASRYIAGVAIIGADELQVFIMVWLIFLGGAMAAVRRAHLRMDVLLHGISYSVAWWRSLIEIFIIMTVSGFMVYVSGDFTSQIYLMEQRSDAAEIPMWIPHGSIVLGFFGILCCSIFEFKALLNFRIKNK